MLFEMQVNSSTVFISTTLSHDPRSTSPAFFVSLEEVIPGPLILVLPYHLEVGDEGALLVNEVETRNTSTVVSVKMAVLPVGGVVNLMFETTLDPQNQDEGSSSEPVFVNYTTIKQEGIGLEVGNQP